MICELGGIARRIVLLGCCCGEGSAAKRVGDDFDDVGAGTGAGLL